MLYVYPKLADIDLIVTRIGGLGLGNMLFTYARALLFAREHDAELIWPTWRSIPVGQILRREDNKRFYGDLFDNHENAIGGLRKLGLLVSKKKISEKAYPESVPAQDCIVEFTGMEGEFEPILGKENSQFLYAHFQNILQERNRKALCFMPSDGICMHIRLGDFTRGAGEQQLKEGMPNLSIPIEWYVSIVKQLRAALGKERTVYVFSDGTEEELRPLLVLGNIQRKTYGTAIGDILAMSRCKIFIASGSTFSRWVRFLGRMNTITYPGQLKQKLLDADEEAFEIEALEIPQEYLERLKRMKK